MILKVCRLGHPVLRRQAERLTPQALASPRNQTLIDSMIETMIEYHGVGLAAPQIHESLAIAVMESQGPRGDIPLTVLVNPSIAVADEERIEEDWEGCLSIPELRGRVPRFARVEVRALDRHGKAIEFTAEGFFARVVQHELDHLMGRVYIDRMRGFGTLAHLEEWRRFWIPQNQ